MTKFKELAAKIVSGVFLAALLVSNGVVISATPAPPTQPEPTTCTECQTEQDALDAAHADLETVIEDLTTYGTQIENLLDQTTEIVYAGDIQMMKDHLAQAVTENTLATGTACQNSTNSFAYYSSFSYEDTMYCVTGETMWFGVDPDFFNFFEHMSVLTEGWDPALSNNWITVHVEMIELLTDYDEDDADNIEDILSLIDSIIALLEECEETNCPDAVECPDCEGLAADLQDAMDELADLEEDANTLDAELTELEADIETVQNQLAEWETLKAEFEQMVEDAGGMHGEDCDDFEVQSGQAWGIAHNFGDVQWCFTNEGQIEEMIQNLDEYWQAHSSSHLPSLATLNQQFNQLMNDYFDKLDEYFDVLDQIDTVTQEISDLATELDDCLTELAALQDEGECLDQDMAPMEDVLADADDVLAKGYEPAAPEAETPSGEEESGEEETGEGELPGDIGGHWAEDFITSLFNGGIVTGDDSTGDFRPDDSINRAEAAKLVTLGNSDTLSECDGTAFPDVSTDDWFCDYTTTAKDNGYFEGYPDGSFGPEKNILRAEAAAVVLRALGFVIPEYTEYTFPDITGDEWYANYAEKSYQCGIFSGRTVNGVNVFAGGQTITRAEMAKIIFIALFEGLEESSCADAVVEEEVVCPDCNAILDELTALDAELTTLSDAIADLEADMEDLETLRDEFRQMVEDAGGMTDADCDDFEVGSGQAMGLANAFGNVKFCLSSESQIETLNESLKEYWTNNSSQHLPSEQALQDSINQAMDDYTAKMDEYIAKFLEYIECLDELDALQADDECLDEVPAG